MIGTLTAIACAILYLLWSHAALKRRVKALEAANCGATIAAPEVAAASVQTPWERGPSTSSQHKTNQHKAPSVEPAQRCEPQIPRAIVFNFEKFNTLLQWMTHNWFYVIAAISLATAGVFLVIYGMEQGLLPPVIRVMISVLFGSALIAAGEFIRRRFGDESDMHTAYLPSVFSGAGIVTLFGSVLSARLLYDFINPDLALLGMAAVGLLALVFGCFYGPLLTAIGVAGSMVSPFIIGGSSDDPSILLVYFALVTIVGLSIDAIRRWAWISVLSLSLGFGAGAVLLIAAGPVVDLYFVIYCATLTLAAIAIPVRRFVPNHCGISLSIALFARQSGEPWPEFPTRLAAGAMIAACAFIAGLTAYSVRLDLFWIELSVLSILILAILVWARKAPALIDLALLPAAAFVIVVALAAPLWEIFAAASSPGEKTYPMMASIVVFMGISLSIVAAWPSLSGVSSQLFLAMGASVFAPLIAMVIDVIWQPAQTIGSYAWALHAMALAAVMSFMAERYARVDGPNARERMSFAVLSALACLTFGIVIMLSEVALTCALAITVVAAAWLDRKFNLPLMGLYITAGISTVGYRLVVDPGLLSAMQAPLMEILLSHGGAVVAFVISYILVKAVGRPRSEVMLESASFSSLGILLSLLLYYFVQSVSVQHDMLNHWAFGMFATVWIILGVTKIRRAELAGPLGVLRYLLGFVFLSISALLLLLNVTLLNPALNAYSSLVVGPMLVNSLAIGYLLPALALGFGAWWLKAFHRAFRFGLAASALGLSGLWLSLVIRHFWQGAAGMQSPEVYQPELYSYTVALLTIGAVLFYQSLAKQTASLRIAGLLFIGLAVAKVFTLDIQGLEGLIRVFALLFLGVSLAALAWLNRWASTRSR